MVSTDAMDIGGEGEVLDWYQKLRAKIRSALSNYDAGVGKKKWFAPFVELLIWLPDLLHLAIKLLFDKNVPAANKGMLIAAIAYVISPIDVIPDSIPIAGWVDDLFVITLALSRFLNTDNPEVDAAVRRHWAGDSNVIEIIAHILKVFEAATGSFPKKLVGLLKGMFGK